MINAIRPIRKVSPRYSHGTAFANWMKHSTPQEHEALARATNININWLRRLARGSVPNPSFRKIHAIVSYLRGYNMMQPIDRLPEVDYEDFL